MIAIPLTQKASWRNPPWITVALIFINVFIFAVFQHNDDEYWMEADIFYFESGLARLEIDFFQLYLETTGRVLAADEAPPDTAPESQQVAYYRYHINQSSHFLDHLQQGLLVSGDDPRISQWRHLRQNYDSKLERVVTVNYGFRPACPRPITWFTSMFLHGSWGHLLGNMVFLWLVGCLIEYGCRHLVFPAVYLLSGIAAVGFFWLLNMQSLIPLVGASGAISGIMGALTVFYGLKKINIFLNLGFYFNYLRFPAIFLLPLWMGFEIFQMLVHSDSPVAYAAHLGGLGGGALMAWMAGRIPGALDRDAFEGVKEDNVGPLVEKALTHMGALEFYEARGLLARALVEAPDNAVIWQHLYIIDRQDPESDRYHGTVQKLLHLYCQQPETYHRAHTLFQEYLQAARPPKLSADLYLRLSYALCEMGEPAEAERIILALLKKAPRLPNLPMALLKLGQSFKRQNQPEKAQKCIQLLSAHYPGANETRFALQQQDG